MTSVIRSEAQAGDIRNLGGTPVVHSLETATVQSLVDLLSPAPEAVVWAAGAGGKGGADRTRKVDYEAAVKIFDAAEKAGVKNLLMLSAIDVRDREKAAPEHYDDNDLKASDAVWNSIPAYMQAKFDADKNLSSRTSFPWTMLRPGRLVDDRGKGKINLGKSHMGQVSREDVAATMIALLERPDAKYLSFDMTEGDQDIEDAVSWLCASQHKKPNCHRLIEHASSKSKILLFDRL